METYDLFFRIFLRRCLFNILRLFLNCMMQKFAFIPIITTSIGLEIFADTLFLRFHHNRINRRSVLKKLVSNTQSNHTCDISETSLLIEVVFFRWKVRKFWPWKGWNDRFPRLLAKFLGFRYAIFWFAVDSEGRTTLFSWLAAPAEPVSAMIVKIALKMKARKGWRKKLKLEV